MLVGLDQSSDASLVTIRSVRTRTLLSEKRPMRRLAEPTEVHLKNPQSSAEGCNEVDLQAVMAESLRLLMGLTVNVRQRPRSLFHVYLVNKTHGCSCRSSHCTFKGSRGRTSTNVRSHHQKKTQEAQILPSSVSFREKKCRKW